MPSFIRTKKKIDIKENYTFTEAIKNINCKDFIYLDPPYAPETKTSFVKYNAKGFNLLEHKKLFCICDMLNDINVKFIMSNADVSLVKTHFSQPKYKIKTVLCRRAINSKTPESTTNEVIIWN